MRRFITCCLPVPFDNVRSAMTENAVRSDGRVSQQLTVMLPQLPQGTMLSADASDSALQPRSDFLPDLITMIAIEDHSATVPSMAPPVGHQAPPWHRSPSLSWSQAGHEQSSVVDAMLEGVRGLLHSEGGATTTFTNICTPSESALLPSPPGFTSPSPSVMTTNAGSGLIEHHSLATASRSSALLVPNQPGATGSGLPPPGSTATTTTSSSPRHSLGSGRNRSYAAVVTGTAGTLTRRRPSPRPGRNNRRRTSSTSTGSSRLLGVSGLATSAGSAGSGVGRAVSVVSAYRESGCSGGAIGAGRAGAASPPPTATLPMNLHPAAMGPLTGPLAAANVMVEPQATGVPNGSLPRRTSFPHSNQTTDSATYSVTAATMGLAVGPPASRIEPAPPAAAVDPIAAAQTKRHTRDAEQSTLPQADGVAAAMSTSASIATAVPTAIATAIAPIQVECGSALVFPFSRGTTASPDPYGSAAVSVSALREVEELDDAVAITLSMPLDGPASPRVHVARERVLWRLDAPLLPLTTASEAMQSQLPLCRLSDLLADVTNAAQPLPLAMGSGRSSIITGVWRRLPVVAKIMCSSSLSPNGAVVMAARRVGVAAHRHMVNVYGIRTAQVDQASVWTLVPEPRRTSRAFAQALAQFGRPHGGFSPGAVRGPQPGPLPHPAVASTTVNPFIGTVMQSPTVTATMSEPLNGPVAAATSRPSPTPPPAVAAATATVARMSAGASNDVTAHSGSIRKGTMWECHPVHPWKLQAPRHTETPPATAAGSGGDGSDGGSEAPIPAAGPTTTMTPPADAKAEAVQGASGFQDEQPTMAPLLHQAADSGPGRRLSPRLSSSTATVPPLHRALMSSDRVTATSPRRMALAAVRPRPGEHIAVMIMEHCEMGDLASLLSMAYNPFRPNRRWSPYMAARAILRCAREVAAALAHLHRRGLVHGGVKPTNVLLAPSRSDLRCFEVKLADACFSGTWLDDSGPAASSTGLLYNSPEALREGPSPPADVWAFGLLLLAMVSAPQPPFAGEPTVPLLLKIVETAYRPPWPQPSLVGPMLAPLQALYERCTLAKPVERPAMEQIYVELRSLESQVRNEKRSGSSGGGGGGDGGTYGTPAIMRPPPPPPPPPRCPSVGCPAAAVAVAPRLGGNGPIAASVANVAMVYGSALPFMDGFSGEATAGLHSSMSAASAWSGDLSGSSELPPLPPMPSQHHHHQHHHHHHYHQQQQQQPQEQQQQLLPPPLLQEH